jgi:ribonuclease G
VGEARRDQGIEWREDREGGKGEGEEEGERRGEGRGGEGRGGEGRGGEGREQRRGQKHGRLKFLFSFNYSWGWRD